MEPQGPDVNPARSHSGLNSAHASCFRQSSFQRRVIEYMLLLASIAVLAELVNVILS